MTFYNKTPLTAFLQIEGFEDAAGSGGRVTSILESLDDFDILKESFSESYLKDEIKAVEEAQKALEQATTRQKPKLQAALIESQGILTSKEQSLDEAFLYHSMQQLSGLIFYPEITDPEALRKHAEQSGNKDRVRDNSPENLAAAIGKYVHVLSAIYPELPEKLFDLSNEGETWNEGKSSGETEKSKREEALTFVTQMFTEHLITSPYQSKSGEHDQGWPTFARDPAKIREIGTNATRLVHQYKALQEEHSYQKTNSFISRASSGEIERRENIILEPAIKFIEENFGLEPERLEGLVKQLNELDFREKGEEGFRGDAMKIVRECGEEEDVQEEKLNNLRDILLPSQARAVEVVRK